MDKLKVAVLFGGRSGEHEISLRSATSITQGLDRDRYEVIAVGITREGRWVTHPDPAALLSRGAMDAGVGEAVGLLPDPTVGGLIYLDPARKGQILKIDVIFPVLHGTFGEDGTVQGMLDMAGIPYVGCGVLASSVAMDKDVSKRVFRDAGLPQAAFLTFLRSQIEANIAQVRDQIVATLGLPCFVKPANLGSSVGIRKAKSPESLEEALREAARWDSKIVVEEAINAREVEVSVLGNDDVQVSVPGEIIPAAEFYDYDAKYKRDDSVLVIPARLPEQTVAEIQRLAAAAFKAVLGSGLTRADFFVEKTTGKVLLNEINTLPGFTSISMYPKLWEASGIPFSELLTRLVELAFQRSRDRGRNETRFEGA